MKRKTTSYPDLLKTVASASHPDLSASDCYLLSMMAIDADSTGKNIRPGHLALADRTKISRKGLDPIRKRLLHLLKVGVITQTHESTGKGDANVYAINLEHPAFPDEYLGMSETAKRALAPSLPKESDGIPITALPKADHRLPDVRPSLSEGPTIASSTKRPSNTPSIAASKTTAHTQGKSVCGVLLQEATMAGEEFDITTGQRRLIEKLAEEHGRDKVLRAGRAFISDPPAKLTRSGPNKTTDPWLLFIDNFERYAAQEVLEQKKAKHKAELEASVETTNAFALWNYYQQYIRVLSPPVSRPHAEDPNWRPVSDKDFDELVTWYKACLAAGPKQEEKSAEEIAQEKAEADFLAT